MSIFETATGKNVLRELKASGEIKSVSDLVYQAASDPENFKPSENEAILIMIGAELVLASLELPAPDLPPALLGLADRHRFSREYVAMSQIALRSLLNLSDLEKQFGTRIKSCAERFKSA